MQLKSLLPDKNVIFHHLLSEFEIMTFYLNSALCYFKKIFFYIRMFHYATCISSWLLVSILLECCGQLFDLTGSNVFLPHQRKASFSLYLFLFMYDTYNSLSSYLSAPPNCQFNESPTSSAHTQALCCLYLKHVSTASISFLQVFSITSAFTLLWTTRRTLSIVEIPHRPFKIFRKSPMDVL